MLPHTLSAAARRQLADGQHPFAIVLCCADSRVPPEHVFDVGSGDIFVVRVAGNVCDPELLASIEYAAEHLGATLGVVLRHRVEEGKFKLVPARYCLASGAVEWLTERPFKAPASGAPAHAGPHVTNVAPHQALQRLQDGHRRFLAGARSTADATPQRREVLTKGQRPLAVVVTCRDSRVVPEHLFESTGAARRPGESLSPVRVRARRA